MTMASSWSYVPNDVYKPTEELIEKLVEIVSKGGNYLLNIGPGPDGEFDPIAYERLKEIGGWMKRNGEAIYGSRMYTRHAETKGVHYTRAKDNKTIYVFLSDFPTGPIDLPLLAANDRLRVTMPGSNKKLSWKRKSDKITLTIPAGMKQLSNFVWVLKVQLQ